jgi:hypothetical protein
MPSFAIDGRAVRATLDAVRSPNRGLRALAAEDSTMPSSRPKATSRKPGALVRVPSRSISSTTQRQLVAAAAGRCEFFGCRTFLYEHHVSHTRGNFARDSHIYAYRPGGPRGRVSGRPANIHGVENLMLLCPSCHDEIDKNVSLYPVDRLKDFKRLHEQRMRYLTDLPMDAQTEVVVLRSTIDRRPTAVTYDAICNAVLPERYPMTRGGLVLDLSGFDREDAGFYDQAMTALRQQVARLHAPDLSGQAAPHYSIFAIAPIPLLVGLGSLLPSTLRFDFYQHHRRGSGTWSWSTRAPVVAFATTAKQIGTQSDRVALLLSVSGEVQRSSLPAEIDSSYTIYELHPTNGSPALGLVASRDSLEAFRAAHRAAIAMVRACHLPTGGDLHIFPAMPPAAALSCGYDLLPKVDPTLVLYDSHRATRGFTSKLRINSHDRP